MGVVCDPAHPFSVTPLCGLAPSLTTPPGLLAPAHVGPTPRRGRAAVSGSGRRSLQAGCARRLRFPVGGSGRGLRELSSAQLCSETWRPGRGRACQSFLAPPDAHFVSGEQDSEFCLPIARPTNAHPTLGPGTEAFALYAGSLIQSLVLHDFPPKHPRLGSAEPGVAPNNSGCVTPPKKYIYIYFQIYMYIYNISTFLTLPMTHIDTSV